MRTLYLCYLSVLEALVQRQVIPYLASLSRRGMVVHLLTFEPQQRGNRRVIASAKAALAEKGIALHALPYHKRPALPATAYDVFLGVLWGWRLIRTHRIDVVHARAHVPAAIALVLKQLTGVPMVFDIRGLMAEEYVEAGLWRAGGLNFRLVKALERSAVRRADAIVTLTERARALFARDGARPGLPFEVIPCCADLGHFHPDPAWRREVRTRLALATRRVVVYAGTFRRWYDLEAMLDFWQAARLVMPDLCFLALTRDSPHEISARLARRSIAPADYRILAVASPDVPWFLSAADFAIALTKPGPSLLAAYPTKIAEYLACGLPIVLSPGIGDADRLVAEGVAFLVGAPGTERYQAAARWAARVG